MWGRFLLLKPKRKFYIDEDLLIIMVFTLDEKLKGILVEEEPKIKRALKMYYDQFDSARGATFNEAAHLAGTNPAYVVWYMSSKEGLGMPSNGMEARKYLGNLSLI